MSAPHTNVETQERRHKPVLVFLRLTIAAAAVALVGFVFVQMIGSDEDPAAAFGNPDTFEAGGEASAAVD